MQLAVSIVPLQSAGLAVVGVEVIQQEYPEAALPPLRGRRPTRIQLELRESRPPKLPMEEAPDPRNRRRSCRERQCEAGRKR